MSNSGPVEYVVDGQNTFVGGQDASKTPEFVREGAVYAAINTTFRNSGLSPRDGFNLLELNYPEGGLSFEGKVAVPFRQLFEGGKFQAIIPYSMGPRFSMLVIISGLIFLIDQETLNVTYIPIADGSMLNQYAARLNWSLASRFVVIFDFPSLPVIIENGTARRSNPANYEVPISTLGAYNQNRLFIANAGNEWTGGDPTGPGFPDAPITFEEISAPGAAFLGQIFQLPTAYQNAPITAIGFLELTDASTGIGPLIIATNNQIFSANTQNPRTTWQSGNFVSCLLGNAGIVGQRAMINVNSDLFFLSNEGQIRSLNMSRNEQSKWSKAPVSREVKNWLKFANPKLKQFTSMCFFNNMIFCTANPYRVRAQTTGRQSIADYAHGGMVAMELDNLATLYDEGAPVWGGLWTGIRPMDFCVNNDRCFVVSKDTEFINHIWEITPGVTIDQADDKERYVKSTVYFKNYDFKNPYTYKELTYFDTSVDNVRGDFEIDLSFRPGTSPNFFPWGNFKRKAPYRFCDVTDGFCGNGYASHTLQQVKFGAPDLTACDPVTKDLYKYFREVQLKVILTGRSWQMPRLLMKAVTIPQADSDVPTCEEYPAIAICNQCNEDWVIPPFDECTEKET